MTVFIGCKLVRVGWVLHWLFMDTHFVWLEACTILVNNTINLFLIIPNILYHVSFIKYLWIFRISLVSIGL